MPESMYTMSLQDGSDGSVETPDRSLNSFSFSTATGEQLDDIQLNLDRMLLDSPAPTSFVQLTPGGMGAGNDGPSSLGGGAGSGTLNPFQTYRKTASQQRQPLQTITMNSGCHGTLGGSDPDNFDRLSLIDVDEMPDFGDADNWLREVPSAALPTDFSEDDRSFLDTNLLNKRFCLLNYVTRAINEELYAEMRQRIPQSTQATSTTTLESEIAGSAATYRVNRLPAKTQSYTVSRPTTAAGAIPINGDSPPIMPPPPPTLASVRDVKASPTKTVLSRPPTRRSPPIGAEPPFEPDPVKTNLAIGSLTFRRAPPIQRQSHVTFNGHAPGSVPADPHSPNGADPPTDPSNLVTGNYLQLGSRTVRLSHPSSAFRRRDSGSVEADFIPDHVSPVAPAPVSRLGLVPLAARNGSGNGDQGDLDKAESNTELEHLYSNEAFAIDDPHEIDTRTYTRPKKTRMSLGTPNRQLNTTMSISPAARASPLLDAGREQALNTTISLAQHHTPKMGTPGRRLNTTIDLSPEHSIFNTPPEELDASGVAAVENSMNLNETFVSAHDESQAGGESRRVTRNLSYVIRREDEESPNNNSSPLHSHASPRTELNNTFSYENDADGEVQVQRGSQNTSMEDLNSRVASQIRSLGCSTITRGRLDHGLSRGPLEETRLVARTSSTDTYSVAHSSESPTSSGLSSPMDTQSYDDIQSSDSVRRSMPNLAVIKNAGMMRSNLAFPQAGGGQLRKNHYISDSRLTRLGSSDRPRLSVHPTDPSHASPYGRPLRATELVRPRAGDERNTSTPASLNRISSTGATTSTRVHSASTLGGPSSSTPRRQDTGRAQGSMGNVRSTGLAPPRFNGTGTNATAASATGSGIRPPRPTQGRSGMPGIPVPTFRAQSRIPGPGQLRFSRPSSRISGVAKPAAQQKGPMDDWRDGCY